MLESMRKYHQSIFIYVVFGLLILVFGVNFGPGSTGCNPSQGSDYAAVVNGETIPREEWAQHYNRQIDMYKRMLQGNRDLDEAFLERLGVRQTVMNNLVGARLVAQEARARGIGVSDEELIKYLADVYGVKGEVTAQQYQNWVQRTFGLTVDRFEEQTKSELAAQKLAAIVQEGVDVSDSELRASFLKEHDRAMTSFVKFDPDAMPKVAVTPAQVDKVLAEKAADVEASYKKDQFKYNTPKQQR
ncbi:MAG TPA: SurA N-terminal domain-containing protein, partial [Myxococcota bacterium]|nr:SurA N-terminal domain-containing protein [Myxococcota bacterium]